MEKELTQLFKACMKKTLTELLEEGGWNAVKSKPPEETEEPPQYLYGIQGIATHFKVSTRTAHLWKNGFLAPAILQRGRTILTNKGLAEELFKQRATQK